MNDSRQKTPRLLLAVPDVAARTGGIAMVSRSLMRLLEARRQEGRIDFRVLSLRGPADARETAVLEEELGSRLTVCDDRRGAFARRYLWQAATWADGVIFAHLGLASLQTLLPSRLRPPALTFFHGIEAWEPLTGRKKKGLLLSDRLVSNTAFTAVKARAINPWLPDCTPCHLGIPPAAREDVDLEAELGFRPGPHDVVIVGRMAKGEGYKGHRELIAALPDVVKYVPDARLIVAGGGDDVETLRVLARNSPAGTQIRFAGYVRDASLRALYARCGVFAMPSRNEGFGLVYLEAMRAGVPCVASTSDAAREVVVDGETGLLVDPDDGAGLARALTRLLFDAGLRKRLGEAGRARFEASFTERHFHERFWSLVEAWLGLDDRRQVPKGRSVEIACAESPVS